MRGLQGGQGGARLEQTAEGCRGARRQDLCRREGRREAGR